MSLKKIVLLIIASLVIFLIAENLFIRPKNQLSARAILAANKAYRTQVNYDLANVGECKFSPMCSRYIDQAILKYGSIKGSSLGIWRIVRCSLLSGHGGIDYP